jgi:hypothetical protein
MFAAARNVEPYHPVIDPIAGVDDEKLDDGADLAAHLGDREAVIDRNPPAGEVAGFGRRDGSHLRAEGYNRCRHAEAHRRQESSRRAKDGCFGVATHVVRSRHHHCTESPASTSRDGGLFVSRVRHQTATQFAPNGLSGPPR